jgi:hypothetical protein
MPLKWKLNKEEGPWFCPVHVNTLLERVWNNGPKFGFCQRCVHEMLIKLRGEGLHESKQNIKRRRL